MYVFLNVILVWKERQRYLLTGFLRWTLSCVLFGVQPFDDSGKHRSNRFLDVLLTLPFSSVHHRSLVGGMVPVVCVHQFLWWTLEYCCRCDELYWGVCKCVCVMFCMLASEYQPDRNRLIRCTFVRFSSLWHQSNYLHMCKELDSGMISISLKIVEGRWWKTVELLATKNEGVQLFNCNLSILSRHDDVLGAEFGGRICGAKKEHVHVGINHVLLWATSRRWGRWHFIDVVLFQQVRYSNILKTCCCLLEILSRS
jgi:hypothetical protein